MRSPERRRTLRQSSSYAPLLLYVLCQVTDQPPLLARQDDDAKGSGARDNRDGDSQQRKSDDARGVTPAAVETATVVLGTAAAVAAAVAAAAAVAVEGLSAMAKEFLLAKQIRQNREGQWYVDSGAAAHVIGDAGKLSSALLYLAKGSVVTGDGSYHKISHIGNAHISMAHSSIPLKNVLVVPNVKKNIISVSKLIDDTQSSVELTPSIYAKDARTKKTFAKGARKGDMYVIEEAPKVERSILVTGFGYEHDDAWATNIDLFKEFTDISRGVRRLGAAAVDMCHVALGIVEAYWEYRLKPWDMAAGVLVIISLLMEFLCFLSAC
ncbi:Phosphatase [Nymphaea thermarum]|nr:Phosphatase [Nymphaea thermarum]